MPIRVLLFYVSFSFFITVPANILPDIIESSKKFFTLDLLSCRSRVSAPCFSSKKWGGMLLPLWWGKPWGSIGCHWSQWTSVKKLWFHLLNFSWVVCKFLKAVMIPNCGFRAMWETLACMDPIKDPSLVKRRNPNK